MWLLLIYKVPNEPSARRVYVWRKLKALGAILVQDSVWVLPSTVYTRERMQWLALEIKEMEGGTASLWEANEIFTGQENTLVEQFTARVEAWYTDILAQLAVKDADLKSLSKEYQQALAQDFFQSPLGQTVRDVFIKKREGNDL